MRSATPMILAACLAFNVGCEGDKAPDADAPAKTSSKSEKSGPKKSKPGPTKAASAKADPPADEGSADGAMTVPKLMAAVKKDEKAVAGKETTVEGTFWGMWKETSEGKTTHYLSIVASKDDNETSVTCELSKAPTGLPKAEMDAHKQAIPIQAKGTLSVRANGKAELLNCTFTKK